MGIFVPKGGPLPGRTYPCEWGRSKKIDQHAYQGCYPAPCKFRWLVFQMRVALGGKAPEAHI
jgi:hypothetical protein